MGLWMGPRGGVLYTPEPLVLGLAAISVPPLGPPCTPRGGAPRELSRVAPVLRPLSAWAVPRPTAHTWLSSILCSVMPIACTGASLTLTLLATESMFVTLSPCWLEVPLLDSVTRRLGPAEGCVTPWLCDPPLVRAQLIADQAPSA